MSANPSELPTLRLSALELLGLKGPADGDWARVRALQYGQLHKTVLIRTIAHALAASVTVSVFVGKVPVWLLGLWLVAAVAATWNTIRIDRSLADIDRRTMTRHEFRRQALGVAGNALVWAAAMILLPPYGGQAEHFALWTLVAMLIASSASILSSAPMGTVVFIAITGGTASASFVISRDYGFAAVILAFITLAISGTIDSARTYLSAKIAEAGVAEKDEVVSLLLREFQENEADWLWQVDPNRRVRSTSPRFAFALGKDPAAAEGLPFIQLIAGDSWDSGQFHPSLYDLAERLKRRESFSNLLVQVTVATGRRWWELSGTPMLDENGSFIGYRGVGSDVTEQRESDEKIAYLARYDTLTGLPNRLMLTEALGEAMRFADQWRSRCAFLMIDLDRFKSVNDSLGHQVGDRLLAQVSQRLKSVIGENEQCGRLGGDEFAIVISDASTEGAVARVAEAVIEALSQPYDVDNHKLYIGASVGSAVCPKDGNTVEMLMRNADLALYRAKDEGGGLHFRYEPSLHANAEERRKLELALRNAIGKQELKLHYQPVVDAKNGTLVSFEALLRWQSKEHGFVSPGKFIPLAEDTRLIVPIGEWVLYEACREAVRWPGDIKVGVNVSGEQLLEPGFSANVIRALVDSGLPPYRLEVEVTESIFLRDARTARQTLEEIMALGCSVALDDFGTGYSSLGYIRALRFSTIKVDRTFVQGAAQGSVESLAIIRAVVAMADSLGMTTTAEGAETAEEVALITNLGCTKIQGYYFGRPMEADEAFKLIGRKGRVAAA
ncbi:putative bifunctional diguanylate cyclase/phosphodiesterase [Altererythrobacter sp. Root672]|uniref:putative bifunctional diguanylate cyclase/phosphodiesterase n=1 Tax=Altererythrobacter sp. Root672 TaxID=1736584 RepID=UPI0006F5D5E9|nr:EAL domain-containing protein [Altererythrobacter sp. Root672]KRA83903.1 diguanylate cyclase [Altererythrobacter sp. Root672]